MKPSFYSDDLNQPTILTDTITTAKTILNNRTGIVSKVFCKLQFILKLIITYPRFFRTSRRKF